LLVVSFRLPINNQTIQQFNDQQFNHYGYGPINCGLSTKNNQQFNNSAINNLTIMAMDHGLWTMD
jgi:hypothetical protein